MMSAQNSSGLAPQCLKMFEHSSSSLGLHCQKMFKQISSNLVSQMSQRRLLASLQAPFLKEKKVYASCALSSKERKSSWFLIILINSVIFVHARSVVCGSVDHCFTKLKKKLCARRRDSFIVSKKRSSDSTKKFKGVPDESTISLEASNVKNGSKTGVPDEEKLNLEWEGRCGQYSNELEVSQAYGQAHMYKLQVTSGTAKPKETTYHGLMHISKDAEFWCHVAIAGLNPEHMQDVFLATNYPKIATRFSFEGKIASYSNQAVPNQRDGKVRTSSDTKVFTIEDGNPVEPTSNKSRVGSFKDGDRDGDTHVKASANSDIIFFFTSAQDGNRLLDDERLSLADDLKKAHDQNQNKSK
ncbi:hypothetical protein Tco_1220051 [Tanacetum coccineum]